MPRRLNLSEKYIYIHNVTAYAGKMHFAEKKKSIDQNMRTKRDKTRKEIFALKLETRRA